MPSQRAQVRRRVGLSGLLGVRSAFPRRPLRLRPRRGARGRAREQQGGERRGERLAAVRARGAVALAALSLACAAPPPSTPPPAPPPRVPAAPPAAGPVPPPPCLRVESLELHKGERRLDVLCEGGREIHLRVALGRRPEGAKQAAGDRRTPEGRYRLLAAEDSRFHLFIPLDYPSLEDARRAYEEGRLSSDDRRRIEDAHANGVPPPADTPLGGGIGLHGEGPDWAGASALLDWTFGCVALADDDIDFLAERAPPGTPIDIRP